MFLKYLLEGTRQELGSIGKQTLTAFQQVLWDYLTILHLLSNLLSITELGSHASSIHQLLMPLPAY